MGWDMDRELDIEPMLGGPLNDQKAVRSARQMTSPFRDRSALVIGVPLGQTDTHSSAPARLDLAAEAPTSVIYGENHSPPDQHDHSAPEQTMYVYSPLPSSQRAHHWCPSTANGHPIQARQRFWTSPSRRRRRSSMAKTIPDPTNMTTGARPEPDHVWPPVPASSAFILGAPLQ
jgi:hypothetical protein